jgi:hypothetical protein
MLSILILHLVQKTVKNWTGASLKGRRGRTINKSIEIKNIIGTNSAILPAHIIIYILIAFELSKIEGGKFYHPSF